MERFDSQYIEHGPITGGLVEHLDWYQAEHPEARLVTVLLMPRNPGAAQTYRAVWAQPSQLPQSEGKIP